MTIDLIRDEEKISTLTTELKTVNFEGDADRDQKKGHSSSNHLERSGKEHLIDTFGQIFQSTLRRHQIQIWSICREKTQ